MAPSSSSSSSSSSSPPLQQPSHFTPIQECDKEEDDNHEKVAVHSHRPSSAAATPPPPPHHHQPTPLHKNGGGAKKTTHRAKNDNDNDSVDDHSVSCNKCRPSAREKSNISVVPLDHHNGVSAHSKLSSPSAAAAGIFRSILSSLTRRSPKPESSSSSSSAAREEQWKIAVAELSHKLIQTTRKRDEAVLEASRLKNSMAELEKKLTKLEQYCHALKSGLDECASIGTAATAVNRRRENDSSSFSSAAAVNDFLSSVAEARNSVRILARSLATQLRHVGAKVHDRIYGGGGAGVKNPRSLLLHLEAVLNRSFFEDFETAGFHRGAAASFLNPAERREAGIASAATLRTLTWEEVLCRGTRHFSGEFSGFCDRKMSDIVAALGWNRAWPEPLLQAFFLAAKSVWIVHLLADSAEPRFEVFRVDKEVRFDPVYMEDMGGGGRRLVPAAVKMMVAPGFYVCGSVVKCKVVCRYNNVAIIGNNVNGIINNNNHSIISNGLISPS